MHHLIHRRNLSAPAAPVASRSSLQRLPAQGGGERPAPPGSGREGAPAATPPRPRVSPPEQQESPPRSPLGEVHWAPGARPSLDGDWCASQVRTPPPPPPPPGRASMGGQHPAKPDPSCSPCGALLPRALRSLTRRCLEPMDCPVYPGPASWSSHSSSWNAGLIDRADDDSPQLLPLGWHEIRRACCAASGGLRVRPPAPHAQGLAVAAAGAKEAGPPADAVAQQPARTAAASDKSAATAAAAAAAGTAAQQSGGGGGPCALGGAAGARPLPCSPRHPLPPLTWQPRSRRPAPEGQPLQRARQPERSAGGLQRSLAGSGQRRTGRLSRRPLWRCIIPQRRRIVLGQRQQ